MRGPRQPAPASVRVYEMDGGWTVRAGRTDEDNDRLTFRESEPRDWWFHVRGCPGSHVVLSAGASGEPPADVMRAAAGIAAWHSRARKGGRVPVVAARISDVQKRRGAPAGQVVLRRERVLKVRPLLPEASA